MHLQTRFSSPDISSALVRSWEQADLFKVYFNYYVRISLGLLNIGGSVSQDGQIKSSLVNLILSSYLLNELVVRISFCLVLLAVMTYGMVKGPYGLVACSIYQAYSGITIMLGHRNVSQLQSTNTKVLQQCICSCGSKVPYGCVLEIRICINLF